jgi:hypothetical protein
MKRLLDKFGAWTPSRQEIEEIADAIDLMVRFLGDALHCAVILLVLYLALEVGTAFLPGGAVERVLGGVR